MANPFKLKERHVLKPEVLKLAPKGLNSNYLKEILSVMIQKYLGKDQGVYIVRMKEESPIYAFGPNFVRAWKRRMKKEEKTLSEVMLGKDWLGFEAYSKHLEKQTGKYVFHGRLQRVVDEYREDLFNNHSDYFAKGYNRAVYPSSGGDMVDKIHVCAQDVVLKYVTKYRNEHESEPKSIVPSRGGMTPRRKTLSELDGDWD